MPGASLSVHQTIDSTGATTDMQLTTAWGEKLPGFSTPNTTSSRYGYVGREKDDESSLMPYRARSYDPRTARFLQKDPVDPVRAHYVYASNNPVLRTDPMGTQDGPPVERTSPGGHKQSSVVPELKARDLRRGLAYESAHEGATTTVPEGEFIWVQESPTRFKFALRGFEQRDPAFPHPFLSEGRSVLGAGEGIGRGGKIL